MPDMLKYIHYFNEIFICRVCEHTGIYIFTNMHSLGRLLDKTYDVCYFCVSFRWKNPSHEN